jgi:putative endonuclease
MDNTQSRRLRGQTAHLFGQSAEQQVARDYERRAARVLELRWRGAKGEIDLIVQDGEDLVFVEVKASKSLEKAIHSLGPAQMARIRRSAEEYLQNVPTGSLTPIRFDLACCDAAGGTQVIENAFGHF